MTWWIMMFFGCALVVSAETNAPRTFCRFVPERSDDFAWENDRVAFRAYGPALRDKPENSGIDCWLKRVETPIIDKWYQQAKAGQTYHKDWGEGLDNYHVGSSAGCGGTGLWLNGKREPLETFVRYEVLECSPEVSQFKLVYEREIDGVKYGEEKTITIRLGERLFAVRSVFTQNGSPALIDPAQVKWQGLHEAFKEMAKQSWDDAQTVYRAAWKAGLTDAELDALAITSSTWEKYHHGFWLKEKVFRKIYPTLNGEAQAAWKRAYFSGDIAGMQRLIAGL